MLAHHDEQSVIDAPRLMMTEHGFQRPESTWYRFSRETVKILDVQPATARSVQRVYFLHQAQCLALQNLCDCLRRPHYSQV